MELTIFLQQKTPIPLNVRLVCKSGEVHALVGPSGSGKSSILRCVAGLHKPRFGKVQCSNKKWFDSEHNIDIPPQQRRVGMVFQHFALFPHLSVIENIMLPLRHLPLSTRRARAVDLLERVNLKGLESRFPAELSGGQQQRVAIARALARDPAVLLLDEPFSAVDHVTRRKLRMEAVQLTRNLNIPVLLVTHDLDEACMLANHISVLHNGTTLQSGIPEEVMKQPANATVARLIDMRNLFEGSVVDHEPENNCTRLEWAGSILEAPYSPEFSVGEKLDWCILPSEVLLHRRVKPSRGIKENPVSGKIEELVRIGGTTNIIIKPTDRPGIKLYMDLPQHVVRRNALMPNEEIGVSLLKNSMHLMHKQKKH
jgi:molybdate transport system ATP-binding protein